MESYKKIMTICVVALMLSACTVMINAENSQSEDDSMTTINQTLTVGTSFSWNTGLLSNSQSPSWVEGTLPPGISASSSSGYLSFGGIPTTSGTYTVTIYAIDDVNESEIAYTYATVVFTVNPGTPETYTHTATLVYNANGGSGAPSTQTNSITSSSPTASGSYGFVIPSTIPTKSGYAFAGWFTSTSAVGGVYGGYTWTVPYDSTVTLYAIWAVASSSYTHTLVYVSNNETFYTQVTTNSNSVSSLIVTSNEPTLEGYVFEYWTNGNSIYHAGDSISVGISTVWLTAAYSALNPFIISYFGNGGINTPNETIVYSAGTSADVAVTTEQPTRVGYNFLGWSTSMTATVAEFEAGDIFTLTITNHVITLFAVWEIAIFIPVTPIETITFYLNGGEALNYTPDWGFTPDGYILIEGPSWVSIGSGVLTGIAQLPGGYYYAQICAYSSTTINYAGVEIYVATPVVTSMPRYWLTRIYKPNGAYLEFADARNSEERLKSVPSLTVEPNAPSKITIDILTDPSYNIMSDSFDGWSDGVASAVEQGYQVVHYIYDELTNQMEMVFNGTIRKPSSKISYVTLTSYDPLMKLYDYKEPMILYGSYVNQEESYDYVTDDTNRDYSMSSIVQTVLASSLIDDLIIDGKNISGGNYDRQVTEIIHELPKNGGYGPIDETADYVLTGVWAYLETYLDNLGAQIYRKYRAKIYGSSGGLPITSSPLAISGWYDTQNESGELVYVDFQLDVQLTAGYTYFVGIESYDPVTNQPAYIMYRGSSSIDSSFASVYRSRNYSGTWGTSIDYYPYWGVEWSSYRVIDTADVSVTGTDVIAAVADSVRVVDTLHNVSEYGFGLLLSYFSADVSAISMSATLIERVGLKASILTQISTKSMAYYATSTYEYLTCIQELMDCAGDNGEMACIRSSLDYPGVVEISLRSALSDNVGQRIFTTDPTGPGIRAIVGDPNISINWEAENGTVVCLSSRTVDGVKIPLAIQSDDRLWGDNSLVNRLNDELINYITDATSQRYGLLAIEAESKIRRVHQNNTEGSFTLRGLWASMWGFTGDNGAGLVFSLTYSSGGLSDARLKATKLVMSGIHTALTMDNIRDDNRTTVANTIEKASDGQTYSVNSIPDTAYVFARTTSILGSSAPVSVSLIGEYGTVLGTQTTNINVLQDTCSAIAGGGYTHISVLFNDSESVTAGYATIEAIRYVKLTYASSSAYVPLMRRVNAWGGQYVHVDVRGPKT